MDLCGDNLDNVSSIDNVPDGTAVKMYGEDSNGDLIKDDVPSGGASAFTDLSDVPQSYTDQAGKMLIVNENENGLEYIDLGTVITDSHTHTNKDVLDGIIDSGDGDEFLSDDGTYKTIDTGLQYFEEIRSVATPNATVPAHQLIAKGAETNIDLALSPKGNGAISGDLADGGANGGNKRGIRAVDFQRNRSTADKVASGNSSFLGGGSNNKASGSSSSVVGGDTNTASGQRSFVGSGAQNVASGLQSAIAGGQNNTASAESTFIGAGYGNIANALGSLVLGGRLNTASGQYSTIAGGEENVASGYGSSIGGGFGNNAAGTISIAMGCYANSRFYAQQTLASGRFAATGDAQRSDYVLRGNTLTTNYYRLYLDGGSALIDLSQTGAYSTWQCKLKVTGIRRLTGSIDHFNSEHNFMIYRENSTPVIADFYEIRSHQVAGSSVATTVSISTNSLAVDIVTTENNWQFVAHLETVETFTGSLV